MPGANCSIFGCSTSRKTKGVAIFKIPAGNDDFNKSWREKLVSIISLKIEKLMQDLEDKLMQGPYTFGNFITLKTV